MKPLIALPHHTQGKRKRKRHSGLQGHRHSPWHTATRSLADPHATEDHRRSPLSAAGPGLMPNGCRCSPLLKTTSMQTCAAQRCIAQTGPQATNPRVWRWGVPGLTAELQLKASGATATLLAQALTGRFRSGGWGTWPAAEGAQLPGEPGGFCRCSEGRWGGDTGAEGLGSATNWSCPDHAVRRFTGG